MSVIESLFVGVFGMAVVFLVLFGLSLLLRLQSALITRFTPKKSVETPPGTPADETAVWDEMEHEAPSLVSVTETHYTESLEAESEVIVSPGPGTVLEVKTYVGEYVRSGDILVILDAMNMEFEIDASRDGTITQLLTIKGATVESGTPLLEIR
jgi:biotin carboxyl carrier protein